MASRPLGARLLPAAAAGVLPAAMLAVIILMVVPIPAMLLDLFFVSNITLSLIMLMVVLHARRPLDISSFPTVLLFVTLFRLALNVASTRVVLVAGHEGTAAAGKVIEAFGRALIGGNFVVGLIVFAIVLIINMMVIAKGAGRVSEVSARFTLDALPGKQMAIDADLAAGMLTPEEAKARRREVASEADFYGSMDGASKFVKGDAVAGLLILVINIVGGLVIGTVSHGLSFGEAADRYILLAVGDALVAQVPALLLSVAAAILVTRSTEETGLDRQLGTQFGHMGAWAPAAGVLAAIALIPAMPTLLFAGAAAAAGLVAWRVRPRPQPAAELLAPPPPPGPSIGWDEVGETAQVTLELGYGLIGLVDESAGSPLIARVTAIRRQLSRELGFVLPMVRVRDEMGLAPHGYRLLAAGELLGRGEVFPQDLLALEAERVLTEIPGRAVTDPAFGLAARWIDPALELAAIQAGYTVVDPATVIGTHLHKVMRQHAAQLFGLDEAHALVSQLETRAPQLAQSLSPKAVPLTVTARLGQALLEEGVPLRDFARVASALVQAVGQTQEPREILELVRAQLGGLIVGQLVDAQEPLALIALAPELEELLSQAHRAQPAAAFPFEPGLGQKLVSEVRQALEPLALDGRRGAIVSQPGPRRALWRLLRSAGVDVAVLGFPELPDTRPIEVVAVIGAAPAPSHEPAPAQPQGA